MKNLNKCPRAFNRVLTKKKEQACEITVKMAQISTSELKSLPRWMILESRQRNKEKGSPIELHIEFYFELCTSHNLHHNFSKFCSIVAQ